MGRERVRGAAWWLVAVLWVGCAGEGAPAGVDAAARDARVGGDGCVGAGCAVDAGGGDGGRDGSAGDGSAGDGSAGDGSAGDGSAADGSAADGSAADGSAADGSAGDGSASDGSASDGGASDGSASDGSASDGSAGDAGAGDAVPVTLAVIDTEPPLLGWRRGERLEVVPFDRATGPGAAIYTAPAGAVDGRFAGAGARWVVGYGLDGDAWIGPAPRRVGAGVSMRGVVVVEGGVVALVGDPDPAMARLVRVDDASGEVVERRFAVEPDARELIGLARGGGELGVLTGDGPAGALWLYRFDEALAPRGRVRVCDLGCDRPGARVVGGPAVAVVHQAVGEVHLTVEGEARAVGAAVRGTLVDARWDGAWVAAWTRPVAAPEGVVVGGARVAVGAVRALALVAGGCVVWVDAEVRWWCG